MKRSTPEPIPASLLALAPPVLHAVAERVRAVVHAALPDATERVLPGWRALGFRHADVGHVAALFTLRDEVRLYFEHGGELPDGTGVTLGRTGRSSYAIFRRASDVKPRALAALVRRAFLAGSERRALRAAARPPRRRR